MFFNVTFTNERDSDEQDLTELFSDATSQFLHRLLCFTCALRPRVCDRVAV